MSNTTMETIKKTIRETGTKIQTETSKFATDHEEEINKVKKNLSETKTKAEESKFGKKVKESADKFVQDHEEGITKSKTRLSEAKIKIEETVKNALAEKRDDEEVVEATTDTADELVEETTSQTLDNDDNGDKLVEEKTSETLDAVKYDDAKEPISNNAVDGKPNYLKSTKNNDDDANKENTSREEKLSNQLKAKLIGAKANLTAFLMKIKKEEKETDTNEDEKSTSSKSQTQVANFAATTNAPSTTTKTTTPQSSKETKLVSFMATAETTSKKALDNARDAFKRATSKRRVSVVTEDSKKESKTDKKQFEEKRKEHYKEETPYVEN